MPVSFKVLPQFELCVLQFSGLISRTDFDQGWREASSAPGYRAEFNDLVACRPDADFANIAYDTSKAEANRYVTAFDKPSPPAPKRTAFVISNQMQSVMVRMFIAYVRTNSPGQVELELFKDFTLAINWLKRDAWRHADCAAILNAINELGLELLSVKDIRRA